MSEVTRPVLRYHGGKWKLAHWIISHFPVHRIYVEPFGGAASVLLRKPRSWAEIYNDLDGEIVNLFRVLRNPAQARELIRLCKLTPYARSEFEVSYITADDPIEQARRTLFRSAAGFSSVGATRNRRVGFRARVDSSRTIYAVDWANLPDALDAVVDRLRGVVIENEDVFTILERYDSPETLFYLDPPYPHSTRMDKKVYRHEMTDDDHRELAKVVRQLKGMVIISGYPCDLYDQELYPDWRRVKCRTYADRRRERTEVLWLSPAVKSIQQSLFDETPTVGEKESE